MSASSAVAIKTIEMTFEENKDNNVKKSLNTYEEFIMSKEQEIRENFSDYSDSDIEIIMAYFIHALEYSYAKEFK